MRSPPTPDREKNNNPAKKTPPMAPKKRIVQQEMKEEMKEEMKRLMSYILRDILREVGKKEFVRRLVEPMWKPKTDFRALMRLVFNIVCEMQGGREGAEKHLSEQWKEHFADKVLRSFFYIAMGKRLSF